MENKPSELKNTVIPPSQPASRSPQGPTLGVIDACGGNLTSLTEALWRLEVPFLVSSNKDELCEVERLILPGVGAAQETMDRLVRADLVDFLRTWTRPLLGICIGMQILFEASDEGRVVGSNAVPLLGLLPGRVTPLTPGPQTRVPHMGWNQVDWSPSPVNGRCLGKPDAADVFYFVHSYRVPDGPWVVGVTDHGGPVPAAVQWKNLYGVQFHPEKSQEAGLTIIRNFLNT